MKTGGSQCEHSRELGFAISIISCPDFWRQITLHDGYMGMHGRSVFGVQRRVYRAMAAQMMRRCGGALMDKKEQEGLGRTARCGRQAGSRRRKKAAIEVWFGEFGRGECASEGKKIVQRGDRRFLGRE